MNDEKLIESIRRAREDEVRFFSNAGKPERERWVIREFLTNLSIQFAEDELISQDEANDVDVRFREANFQVKELTEPNCRRSLEVRAALKKAKTAVNPIDCFDISPAQNKEYADAYPRIVEFASDSRYPLLSRSKLDLLIYITDTDATLDVEKQPDELSDLGWRSISCIFGRNAYILVATDNAPNFLIS